MEQCWVPFARGGPTRHILQTVLLTLSLTVFALVSGYTQQTLASDPSVAPQSFALSNIAARSVAGGKAEAAEYLGRKAVRLTSSSDDSDIFAYVNGSAIQDGVIEVALAVKITTPPGVRMPGFTGIAFRARSDGSHYDMFYVRPRNAISDDQAMAITRSSTLPSQATIGTRYVASGRGSMNRGPTSSPRPGPTSGSNCTAALRAFSLTVQILPVWL